MDLAWISLTALLVVIVASCTTKVNPGILSIMFAWIIGVYVAPAYGTTIKIEGVVAGFPRDLFLTLVGVTVLFTAAYNNGTLEQVARVAVGICRGNVGMIGVMFFLLTMVFSSIGMGNIAAAALFSPLAMRVAEKARMPAFLMTIAVAHGSLAGALSPVAPTGVIAQAQMKEHNLDGYQFEMFWQNLVAQAVVAFVGYFLFGGWRLFAMRYHEDPAPQGPEAAPAKRLEARHWLTLAVIMILLVAVTCFNVHVGMGAFAAAAVLTLAGVVDEREAIRKIPWSVIVMVCGVTVLTALLDTTGGSDRFKEIIREIANPELRLGVIALVTGVVSVYSSTSGVVLPAFLPLASGVGGDPLAIALAIIVAGHLVDSSPLSTIGALCIASAPASEDRRVLFNKVLAWGLSMAFVGAVFCYVAYGLLWNI